MHQGTQAPLIEIGIGELTGRLEHDVCNSHGQHLRVVRQQGRLRARDFEEQIYQQGQLAVRPGSLHDLLNMCMWCLWPKSKAALNALHVEKGYLGKGGHRSAAGNAGTLLDECGIVIVSPTPGPGELIRSHEWLTLFVEQRSCWHSHWEPWAIGHGLLEQMLSPFDGIMGKCLVLQPPTACTLDQALAREITQLHQPGQLLSLPALGVPGWHPANRNPSYYANTSYFRP